MINNILATNIWGQIGGIAIAVLVLLFMVTIHELGHYVAGKKLGFKINEFSIGFGPAIFKKKVKSGEFFSIRIIPLGGYCAFEGDEESSETDGAFDRQKPWKRIIVLAAGAFMNFFITAIIVILTFSFSGQYLMKINDVMPSAPDESVSTEYILEKDDLILEINGKNIYMLSEMTRALDIAAKTPNEAINVKVLRDGEKVDTVIFLRDHIYSYEKDGEKFEEKRTGLGVTVSSGSAKFGFFESIGRGFTYCFKMGGEVLTVLGQLLTGKLALTNLSGPISTIQITAEIASYGFRQLLEVIALIGVNLAVFNLLPIPALDGSRIVFTIIEWIRRKPINKKVETMIHFAGLVFLFGFAILVDLLKWI